MSKPLVDRIPFAKIVSVLAVALGVGIGLCGLDFFLGSHGIGRHPVQVYEILFLILLGLLLSTRAQLPQGARFRIFLGGYLVWRVCIDFFKKQPLIHGLNLIQWSCLAGILVLIVDWAGARRGEHGNLQS